MSVTDPTHIDIPNTTPNMTPQHWSQRSGVMASPTMTPVQQTPKDFLLNRVNDDEMGGIPPPFNHHEINCPCSPNCKNECCRRHSRRRSFSPEADASTRLLPERTNGDDRLSSCSYGSTDSNDNLIERDDRDVVGPFVGLSVWGPLRLTPVMVVGPTPVVVVGSTQAHPSYGSRVHSGSPQLW